MPQTARKRTLSLLLKIGIVRDNRKKKRKCGQFQLLTTLFAFILLISLFVQEFLPSVFGSFSFEKVPKKWK